MSIRLRVAGYIENPRRPQVPAGVTRDFSEAVYSQGMVGLGLPTLWFDPTDCTFGLQIHEDGRVWVCINGETFLRFKPAVRPEPQQEDIEPTPSFVGFILTLGILFAAVWIGFRIFT